MENIFKNACFGKTYKTRDGKKAIYIKDKLVYEPLSHTDVLYAQLVLETSDIFEVVKEIGVSNGAQPIYDNLDIVSEWKDEINEEELDKLADEESLWLAWVPLHERRFKEGFKAGYRKAKS